MLSRIIILLLLFSYCTFNLFGQVNPGVPNPNTLSGPGEDLFNKADSTLKQESNWDDKPAKIYYKTTYSELKRYIDTSIGRFHHYQPHQPYWGKDLGNAGTAIRNLFFAPVIKPGLSLGYHIYDMYMLDIDSVPFYNTTRPYSEFVFMLGGKTEQNVSILHTQNINPNWNIAAKLQGTTSPGYYLLQRTNFFSANFSSSYQSTDKKYNMQAALLYHKFKQQENGGIASDSFLTAEGYENKQLIPVMLPQLGFNNRQSAVSNTLRNVDFLIRHSYAAWGLADTTYNEDSTAATYTFTPRFTLRHQLQIKADKHVFLDKLPESSRYSFIEDTLNFSLNDSVYNVQNWFYIDNKFSLNGFWGKNDNLAMIEIGIANKVDRFSNVYEKGQKITSSLVSNYVFGNIKKDAHKATQWNYNAEAELYFTGVAAGNFLVSGNAGKGIKEWAYIAAEIRQSLSNAPYSWERFKTKFYDRNVSFNPTSITQIGGQLNINKLHLYGGIRNYLVANYLYYDLNFSPLQQTDPFSLLQVFARKDFKLGIFFLENEVIWQQATGNAPLNLPSFMLRHLLRIETPLFKKAIHFSAGIEGRYHSPYYADGYSPYFNQFYYQSFHKINNKPEFAAFFNFKVKGFRAFVLGEYLGHLIWDNNINAPGYPVQDAMFRFGFTWTLVN